MDAAMGLLVEGRTDVAVLEIADRAGVALGSFYNHFSTKDELFNAAIEVTLAVYSQTRDELVADISDPAEVFATSFRVTGRLIGKNPALAKLLLHDGFRMLMQPDALRPRAIKDISRAVERGSFRVADIEVAFMGVAGVMWAMARLLVVEPERDVAFTSDQFARMSLRSLGCAEAEVARLMECPIPEVPELASLVALNSRH